MASSDQDYADHTTHHIIKPPTYFTVFVLLLIGTVLTVVVATFDLGVWNTPIALLIAVTKATLVFLFFMGVRWYAPMLKTVALSGFIFFGILVAFTMSDFISRDWGGASSPRSLEPSIIEVVPEVPNLVPSAAPQPPTVNPGATPIGTQVPTGEGQATGTPGVNPGDTDRGR